jgi:hypothetical protein
MATVEHFTFQYDLGFTGPHILPGESYWVSFGPADGFEDGTVILKAYPDTHVGTTVDLAMNVLSVGDIFSSAVPIGAGAGAFVPATEGYVGANITNAGQNSIRWFRVFLTVIRP